MQLQVGFIDFVVGPFFRAVVALVPRLAFVTDGLARNRAAWDRCSSDAALLFAVAPAGGGGLDDDDKNVAAAAAAPSGPRELESAALGAVQPRE